MRSPRHPSRPSRLALWKPRLCLTCGIIALTAPLARAAAPTWTGVTDGNWATGTNWSTGTAPGSTTSTTNTDTAIFNGAGNGHTTLTIDPNRNLEFLTFDTAAASYTIGSSGANGGNALLLTSDSTANTFSVQITSGLTGSNITETFNAPIVLEPATSTTAGTHSFANFSTNSTNSLVFAGNISAGTTTSTETLTLSGATGSGMNIISGAISNGGATGNAGGLAGMNLVVASGTWDLTSTASTFSGTTQLNSGGTLAIGASSSGSGASLAGPLGSGALVFSGGTIQAVGGAQTIGNQIAINNDTAGTIAGSNDLTFTGALSLKVTVDGKNFQHYTYFTVNNTGLTTFAGGIDLNNQQLIFQGTGRTLVNSTIIDSAPGQYLRYQGTGQLILSGANTYTDRTDAYQGALVAATNAPSGAAGAFGNSTAAVTLGSTVSTITGPASIVTNGAFTIGRNIAEVTAPTNSLLSIGGVQTSGTSTYTGNISLTKNTTLTSAAGGEVDFTTGVISGAYSLTIDGGGLVKLTGANTFSGGSVTIQNGSILNVANVTNNGALGASANALVFNNGTLQFGAVFDPSVRTMTFNSGGAIFDTAGQTITFANPVGNGGAGGLTLRDSAATKGTLVLAAANTYTGGNTVSAGTLQLSGAGTLGGTSGPLTVSTGGTLDLNGTSQAVGILTGTGGTVVNNGTGVSTLTVGSGNTTGGSYAGVVANNNNAGTGTVALTKTGSGVVTLTGANTYTGSTAVNAGTLAVGGATGSLGGTAVTASGSGTLLIGTNLSTATTTLGTGVAGSVAVNSGGGLSLVNGAFNQLALNGASGAVGLSLGGGGSVGFDLGASTSDKITLGSGVLTQAAGSTTVNLTLLSSLTGGTQTLIAGNFSGTTDFTLGTTTNTSFLNGYTLSLQETSTGLLLLESQTSAAYWKGTTSASWAAINNFTTDQAGTTARTAPLDANTAVTFIANGGTNFANTTLDGSYTINSLVFNVGGVGINNGTGTNNTLTIASGGGITVNGGLGAVTETIGANVALGASQTWTVADAASTLSVGGNVSGAFGLSKAGLGTLVLSGTNTYSGQTTVAAGNLNVRSNGALGGTSGVVVGTGAALQLQGGITTSAATPLTLNGTGAGTAGTLENVSGTNTYTGLITLASASTIGSDAGSLILSNAGTITGPGLSLTLAGAGNGMLASVVGTGSGSLSKIGAGTWTLSGANNYTGGTTVGGGTLALTGAGTLGGTAGALTVNAGLLDLGGTSQTVGTLAGAGGSVANNAAGVITLTVGGGNATGGNYAGSLANGTGTLALVKTGTGTQTLSGVNTYTGPTTVSGGALNIANTAGLGNATTATSGVSVAGGAALQLTGGAGSINTPASVGVTLNGTGTGTAGALESVSGTNTFAGPVTLGSAATIGADAGTLTLNSATAVAGGGNALSFAGAGNITVASVINATTASLNLNGTGTVTLSGNNSYTGSTNLNSGTLVYTSVNALGSAGTTNNGSLNLGSGTNNVNLTYAGPAATLPTQLYFTGTGGTVTLGNIGTGPIHYVNNGVSNQGFFYGAGGARTIQLGNATDSIGGTVDTIIDNDYDGSATTVTKAGLSNSLWILGASTYTGPTNIIGGVLQTVDLAASSPFINLNGSDTNHYAVLQGNGTFARTTGGGASVNGPVVNVGANSGFSAQGGKLTVTLNGGAQLTEGLQNFLGAGGSTFALESTTSDSQVEVTNAINLNTLDAFSKLFYVEKGVGGDSALLSGVISNGTNADGSVATAAASGITKQGRGTLILSGANTFSGLVTVSGGSLVAAGNSNSTISGVFGTGTGPVAAPTAPSAITLGDGNTGSGGNPAVLIGGAFTVNRPLTVTDSGTNNTYSIGGTTDANSTFSGLITVTTGNTAANNNTFTVTQVATTGTDALTLSGGMAINKAVIFNDVGAVNVTGAIIGAGTVAKTNAGLLTLTAANTYTGATTVSAGTLLVNGSTAAASLVAVSGGTLGGAGTVNGATTVNSGGRITGGALGGVGTLNVANALTLNSGSVYQLDLGTGAASDVLAITGLLTSNGATINVNSGAVDGTDTYLIATYPAGEAAGSSFVLTNAPNYHVVDTGTMLELVPGAPVPEPSTWVACGFGLLAAVGLAKRKRSAAVV